MGGSAQPWDAALGWCAPMGLKRMSSPVHHGSDWALTFGALTKEHNTRSICTPACTLARAVSSSVCRPQVSAAP